MGANRIVILIVSIEAEQIDREMVEMAIIPKLRQNLGDEFNTLAMREPQMLEWRRQTRNDAFLRNLFHNLTSMRFRFHIRDLYN